MEQKDELELDLLELLSEVWKRKQFIALVVLFFAVITFAVTYFLITPQYSSTSSFYVINHQDGGLITSSDMSVSTSLTADFETLISSRTVLEQVIEQTNLNMSYDSLAKKVSVSNPNGTRFLMITVSHENPAIAKRLADSIADIASEKIVDLLGIDKVNIMDYGRLPEAPSSPSLKKNIVIGAAAGFLLSAGIVLLLFILDGTIKTAEDAERSLGVSVLGVIPLQEDVASPAHSKKKTHIAAFARRLKSLTERG